MRRNDIWAPIIMLLIVSLALIAIFTAYFVAQAQDDVQPIVIDDVIEDGDFIEDEDNNYTTENIYGDSVWQ